MSHFNVAVFLDGTHSLEELLEPYYECLRFPHYISREEIISGVRSEIERFKNTTYSSYLENKEEYIEKYKSKSPHHLDYLENEFPKMLSWTDDECLKYGTRYYEPENIKPDGSVFDDSNPNAKWDWYEVGGRWKNEIVTENGSCDRAFVRDILFSKMPCFTTYAVVTPNGEWLSPGEVGWWGLSTESEEDYDKWKKEYSSRFLETANPDWEMVVVDCHI